MAGADAPGGIYKREPLTAMNPLNPWVALIEILLLLGLAFGLGRCIAFLQYRRQIQAQQRAIQQLQQEKKQYLTTDE